MKRTLKKQIWMVAALLVAITVAATGCGGSTTTTPAGSSYGLSGVLDITGSNTVTPVTTLFAEEFMKLHNRVNISVSGPGSGAGIAAIINGTTDICQSSRPIRQSELDDAMSRGKDIKEIRVATDALAVIVHPSNPVDELTIEQISAIYTGRITNWREVGGNDAPIVALARDTNSGTHVYFKEAVVQMDGLPTKDTSLEYGGAVQFLPSTATGVTQTAQNTNAIFYPGLGYLNDSVKVLGIKKTAADAAVKPSVETALNDTYPISRGLFYYVDGEPTGLIKSFIDFALSADGQALVLSAGFVPVK